MQSWGQRTLRKMIAPIVIASSFHPAVISLPMPSAVADEVTVKKEPVFTKRVTGLEPYSDIQRGFKLQRPFGFNEFQGQGI